MHCDSVGMRFNRRRVQEALHKPLALAALVCARMAVWERSGMSGKVQLIQYFLITFSKKGNLLNKCFSSHPADAVTLSEFLSAQTQRPPESN